MKTNRIDNIIEALSRHKDPRSIEILEEIGTNIENPKPDDIIFNKDKGIYSSHVYRLLPATIDENNKITEFYVINPLGATKVKLTLDELVHYGQHIYCAVKEKDED